MLIPEKIRCTFSRFLTDTNNSEIEALFHTSGQLLVAKDVAALDVIMTDSKPIKANTNHNNPKNPNRKLDNYIVEKLKAEPFIPLNRRNQQPDKTVGPHGLPLCPAGLEMKFAGISTDGARTRKKFRCPIIAGSKKGKSGLPDQCPIDNDHFCTGKCYGCTAYIDITDDHRTPDFELDHRGRRAGMGTTGQDPLLQNFCRCRLNFVIEK